MMKEIKNIILLLFMAVMLMSAAITAYADEEDLWNKSVYHISDFCDVIPNDMYLQENAENELLIEDAEFDFSVMIVETSKYEDWGFGEYLDKIYAQNNMGYGVNHDGIILGLDPKTEKLAIRLIGRGKEIFKRADVDELTENIRAGYAEDGYLGAVHAFHTLAYEKVIASDIKRESQKEYELVGFDTFAGNLTSDERCTAPIINGVLMPSWYVEDPENFVDFHNDESDARLIDNADILSEEEEKHIAERLAELRGSFNQDIVIFTDNTSYGLDNELYEMDYYVYNGYGCGDDFDGLMLFINMDPDNREMVSTAFGSMREKFTKKESVRLDDILYDRLVEQEYYKAFMEWMDGLNKLIAYGSVNVPDWYVNYMEGKMPENASDIKIVNEFGYLSAEDTQKIDAEIREMIEKYHLDIVVYISSEPLIEGDFSDKETTEKQLDDYLDMFYEAHGYGVGKDKRGVVIAIFDDVPSQYRVKIHAHGSVSQAFTYEIRDRLESITLLNLAERDYNYNINRCLTYLGKFLKSGKLPHTWPIRIFWSFLCSIVGYIAGALSLSINRGPKVPVKVAEAADELLVKDSFKVIYKRDILESTDVDRVYIGDTSSSSSSSSRSGSSSRSSYSSSSHSSSGRSGTTSRRKF